MAARKSGEALVYKRIVIPKLNETDPTDNPSFGDMWIDISVNPPVVKILDNLLNAVTINATLTPPVTITGTNAATIPLTVIPAAAQSTSTFVVQKRSGDSGNDFFTIGAGGNIVTSAVASGTGFAINSSTSGIALLVNQNATGQPGVRIAHANANTVVSLANTAWDVLDDQLSDRAGFILARGAATPTIQLRILRYAGFGTAFANGYLSFFAQDGTTAIFGVNADGGVNITPSATSTIPIFINSPSGQVANLITAQVNAATLFGVGPSGQVNITTLSTVTPLTITPTTGTSTVFQIAAPTGFAGLFIDWTVNNVTAIKIDLHGNTTFGDGTVAPTVGASQIGFGSTTATSATAGVNGAVPAQVVGYWIVNIAGTQRKIPFFAN